MGEREGEEKTTGTNVEDRGEREEKRGEEEGDCGIGEITKIREGKRSWEESEKRLKLKGKKRSKKKREQMDRKYI